MPTKIELIVDNLDDNDAFDAALPGLLDLARALPALERIELGKVWPKEDGTATPAFRTVVLYFPGYDQASAATSSAEGAAFFPAFFGAAGGKVTGLFTHLESA